MSAACSIRMPRPFYWPLATASAPGLTPGQGGALVRTLRTEGLIEGAGRGIWTITQAGQTSSSATAAKPVTRAAAERALSRFLERVTQVNQNPCFLAKATSIVLFGSMLKPEVERLSDLDLAVELTRKEPDIKRAQEQNQQRAEELANMGRSFRNVLEWEFCWHGEAFRFLKGRSRVISLADFNAEKTFVTKFPATTSIGVDFHEFSRRAGISTMTNELLQMQEQRLKSMRGSEGLLQRQAQENGSCPGSSTQPS